VVVRVITRSSHDQESDLSAKEFNELEETLTRGSA
jgi:hypothetical protein